MKKKILAYIIGVLVCIIIDAGYVAIAIHHEAPVSDYILMGIFLPIFNILSLAIFGLSFDRSENKCLVFELPDAVDDKLPKLK